jgi:tetratricopeptide (TPR) repeat protein
MNLFRKHLFLSMLTIVSLSNAAPEASATKSDLEVQEKLFQAKLDARNEKVEALNKRLDDQIARTADIGSGVDRLSVSIAAFGVLLTVVLFFGGLIGYFSTVSRARREAQEAAKKWFDENAIQLGEQIKGLESSVVQAKSNVGSKVQEFRLFADDTKSNLLTALSDTHIAFTQAKESKSSDVKMIADEAIKLIIKSEANYSFNDWNILAFAAVSDGNIEKAIFYWDKAINVSKAPQIEVAKAMLNKGVALGNIGRLKDSIVAFAAIEDRYEIESKSPNNLGDWIFNQYGVDPKIGLRQIVAMAKISKDTAINKIQN